MLVGLWLVPNHDRTRSDICWLAYESWEDHRIIIISSSRIIFIVSSQLYSDMQCILSDHGQMSFPIINIE